MRNCGKNINLQVMKTLSFFMSFWNDHAAKFKSKLVCLNCAPVAQLVEHRAVTREAVRSTLAGPTLKVLK